LLAVSRVQHDRIAERIEELGEWFHNIELRGHLTAPHHFLGDYPTNKWKRFADAVPSDLSGCTVLDIGCNGGFYSIAMKRRGADRVVAIDSDERYLAQARFAAEISEVSIDFRCLSVYDVATLRERFDIVLFLGVLYHLRHPLLALDLLHEHVTRDLLIFQSMLRGFAGTEPLADNYPITETAIFDRASFPKLHFVEGKYANDLTNWWIPNRSAAEAMLRSAGFRVLAQPEEEVFICQHGLIDDPEPRAVYPRP
jgi:tRNA (mo5U34)-methyltransferase